MKRSAAYRFFKSFVRKGSFRSAPFLLGILAIPLFVYASFFSFVGQKMAFTSGERSLSSQNIPLLVAQPSIDPHTRVTTDPTIVDRSALMAEAGPSGAHVDEAASRNEIISTYVVRKGDTLASVAALFDVSPNTIVWANNLTSKSLSEGQILVILPVSGVKYTVKEKDTLETVAKKFKGDADDIADFNGIPRGSELALGSEIIIPDGEMPEEVVPTTTTTKKPPTKAPLLGRSIAQSGYFLWPVAGGVLTQGIHGHNGVDIGAPTGNSVFAAAAGTIILTKSDGGWNGGYGNYIVVAHSNGTQTLYAHLSRVAVSVGDAVAKGFQIGNIGSTGHSTGPHLHFEVRGGKNPFGY